MARSTTQAPLTREQFDALTDAKRSALVTKIARDREAGLSGNDLRAKYGDWLTGPMRRKLFRTVAQRSDLVARSYNAYRDGDTRKGSAHAKFHGAQAPVPAKTPRKRSRSKAAA